MKGQKVQQKVQQQKEVNRPALAGRVQKVEVVRAPSAPGAKDGEYRRENVGKIALWPVKQTSDLGAFLFGQVIINNRKGRVSLYHYNGASINSPVLKGDVMDHANNVVGEVAIWDGGQPKNPKAPRYWGLILFQKSKSEYRVSLWGDMPVVTDGESSEDAPF